MKNCKLSNRGGHLSHATITFATIGAILFLCATAGWAASTQVLRGQVPDAVASLNLKPLARLAATNRLNLAIALPGRNQDALTTLLQQLYDPTSSNYHQFLTTDQFTEAFGPPDEDYQAVIAFRQRAWADRDGHLSQPDDR